MSVAGRRGAARSGAISGSGAMEQARASLLSKDQNFDVALLDNVSGRRRPCCLRLLARPESPSVVSVVLFFVPLCGWAGRVGSVWAHPTHRLAGGLTTAPWFPLDRTALQVVQCSQNPSDPNRQAAHQLMMEMQQDAEMWCVPSSTPTHACVCMCTRCTWRLWIGRPVIKHGFTRMRPATAAGNAWTRCWSSPRTRPRASSGCRSSRTPSRRGA